jgi:hypothetical protein
MFSAQSLHLKQQFHTAAQRALLLAVLTGVGLLAWSASFRILANVARVPRVEGSNPSCH